MRKRELSDGVFCREGRVYLWYLIAWLVTLLLFLLCEAFIDPNICHEIWSPLDDVIPFSEGFVVFYVLWYFMIIGSIVWLGLYRRESFRSFLLFMTACQLLGMLIFLLYPNKQLLRPEIMPRDNAFADLVLLIHSVDTNTNVCPSMHVAYSVAMSSVWSKERSVPLSARGVIAFLCLMVCLSTVFIKQHSVIDGVVALIICIPVELVIYRGFWKELFTKTGENK